MNYYFRSNINKKRCPCIDIYIENSNELFKQFNFASPIEKVLRGDIENYIYENMKHLDFPESKYAVLKIHLLNPAEEDSEILAGEIHRHFQLKCGENEKLVKQKFYHWCGNMIIGILFLIFCLMLVQFLDSFESINAVKIIKESLMIIGWVAIWEPTTFILFQWRGIKKSRSCYRKLCSMPVLIEDK